ncbi:DUF4270 family protein [Allomuricauda sp. SCSIO 65647]|uniref:DUF4270 family protein n=1 Tax=Allomuricauda sp. SCSIO 65647 TaxID=2908843 RepID=UPI001F2741FE|nr:DUF4270 family protein [Muricauda sp. SCSIO 65647]UJH69143.1 DUF4270 domain-containing protein [Muricauda sp. SCSIO 65647]
MGRLAVASLICLLVAACSIDSSEIPTLEVGQDFVNSNIRVIVLDTFDLRMSTFRFDSINSSESIRLLYGQYIDDYFGTVRAEPYFELVAPVVESVTGPYDLPEDAELDSVALILGYDGYSYNDTTRLMQINVHRLLEDVTPEEGFFYNTSRLKFDSVPIASRSFEPEPIDEDSLHISLPFEFGQEIFEKIAENDINNNQDLRDVLNGLTLQPNLDENGSVIGFSKNQENTYLRFFYSVPEEFEDSEETLDLVINPFPENPVSFNNITTKGSPLDSLVDQEDELFSDTIDDLAFIQSGTGFATKIVFPTIKKLYDIPGTGTILNAQLEIKPLKVSNTGDTPVRDTLNTGILDRNNVIAQEIITGIGAVQGVIVGEEEEFGTVRYEIPIGIFLDGKLTEERDTETSLVLFNEDFNATVNRVVLQGESNSDFEARVIITYAIYDE